MPSTPQDPAAVAALKKVKDRVQSELQKYRGTRAGVRPPRPPHSNDFARLARRICGTSVGVVLGGGGARGLSHLVCWHVPALRFHLAQKYTCRGRYGHWKSTAYPLTTSVAPALVLSLVVYTLEKETSYPALVAPNRPVPGWATFGGCCLTSRILSSPTLLYVLASLVFCWC